MERRRGARGRLRGCTHADAVSWKVSDPPSSLGFMRSVGRDGRLRIGRFEAVGLKPIGLNRSV